MDQLSQPMLRVQLVADVDQICALEETASARDISVERHQIPSTDQNFGVEEVGVLIGVFYGIGQVAELLAGAWKKLQRKTKITVKTPKGAVTVEGEGSSPEEIVEKLRQSGVF